MRREAILVALAFLAARSAPGADYYSIAGGGAQLDVGDARRPLGSLYSTGTGTAGSGSLFPALFIPPNPNPGKALVRQSGGPDPKQITIPPGALARKAPPPARARVGVAKRNPYLLEIRTRAAFSVPAPALGSAVLRAGGRTGAPTTSFAGPGTTAIRYVKTSVQFGGPAQIKVQPVTPTRLWARSPSAMLPCKHPAFGGADASCVAPLIQVNAGTLAAPGAKVGFTSMSPGEFAMSPGVVAVSVPLTTGLVAKSAVAAMTAPISNKATSAGFPWTTGMVTISAASAKGAAEIYTLTGMDSRMSGAGKISLVSGGLSLRVTTGANANRGWLRLSLPEPGAWIGTTAALAALAGCHAGFGRRAKRRD